MTPLEQLQYFIDQKQTIGIDVSTFQGHIDFKDLANKYRYLDFVCCKASQGDFVDEKFEYNFTQSQSNHFFTGSYHFFMDDVDPILQAELFYKQAKQSEFIALDYESHKLEQHVSDTKFLNFAKKVKELFQINPFLYTYPGFEHFTEDFKEFKPWIACYTTKLLQPPVIYPWQEARIWQFAGTAEKLVLPNGKISDFNVFLGSVEEFSSYITE